MDRSRMSAFFPALLLLVLLIGLCAAPQRVRGWSGDDAYTIVVLSSFDTDTVLQEQFYNAPAGTSFILSRDGYRILDASLPAASPTDDEAALSHPLYPLEPMLSTSVAYRGTKAGDAPLPFRGRFSDEWVVRTKEDAAHSIRGDDAKREPLLLHCRLPLPHNTTETARQRRRYVARHAAALSSALERWFHTDSSGHTLRCLHGNGEQSLTGVERYYELCPAGVVSRVQHHRLTQLLRGGTNASSLDDTHEATKVPTVLDFLRDMHESPAARNAILRNPRYRGVFEEIGRYDPHISKPRWSEAHLAWESWYPSVQPCRTHYTTPSAANASRRWGKVHPADPYWKSVVRFRCPTDVVSEGKQKLLAWAVTEVRQLCEYQIEVTSPLVCGWEQELDSFSVNPVPCVVLD